MMILSLLLSFAHADCEQPPQDIVVWPNDSVVAPNTLLTLRGAVSRPLDVILAPHDDSPRVTTTAVRSTHCNQNLYTCAVQRAPDTPLAADTVYSVLINDTVTASFTTATEDLSLDPPSAPDVFGGVIQDHRSPDYPGYSATWDAPPLLPGEWLDYEARGQDVRAHSGASATASVVLGSEVCTYAPQIDGELLNAEVRIRRVTPTGVTGDWSDWVDVDPDETIIIDDRLDTGDGAFNETDPIQSCGCQSHAPAPASALLIVALLALRRRE